MKITFLGHAGFFVETKEAFIIMDAWLSKEGAFDGAWFQFPRNHHLADFIFDKLHQNNDRKVFVYVSHEHKDHFDEAFLRNIDDFQLTYILPKFRRSVLVDRIQSFTKNEIILVDNEDKIDLNDEDWLKIFIDDSELNRDSAILLSSNGQKFLNLNDCKIHDKLTTIKKKEGQIAVFAVQFSGATWHPTCYDYSFEDYARISKKKKLSKFEATALAIENLKPNVYIPSAGPACFLDPDLIHINFQKESIFPRNYELIQFLDKRLTQHKPTILDMMPGDELIVGSEIKFNQKEQNRVDETNFENYIKTYASDYQEFFKQIKQELNEVLFEDLVAQLIQELQEKLITFSSRQQIKRNLFIGFFNKANYYLVVDFENYEIKISQTLPKSNFYLMMMQAYDLKRILEGYLTWEDYALTFRMRLNREPDIYQVLMQGFMILEKEDLNFFCEKILALENKNERIIVELGGCRYSVDRYCPHQGADLAYAWKDGERFLVCPRHRWAFDVENGGECATNSATINAISLDNN